MAVVDYTVAILSERRDGNRRYYRADALGSTVGLYNDSQTKTDSFKYWPYGATRSESNPTGTKYKYVGTLYCRAQADGGIYMQARVEDPENARWMTVDPLWPAMKPYAYSENSPASNIDPTGRLFIIVIGIIAVGTLLAGCATEKQKPKPKPKTKVVDCLEIEKGGNPKRESCYFLCRNQFEQEYSINAECRSCCSEMGFKNPIYEQCVNLCVVKHVLPCLCKNRGRIGHVDPA